MTTYIKDLVDLPERVHGGDFVLKLNTAERSMGRKITCVGKPAATMRARLGSHSALRRLSDTPKFSAKTWYANVFATVFCLAFSELVAGHSMPMT